MQLDKCFGAGTILRNLILILLLFRFSQVPAQQTSRVDIFMGAELHYRDINYNRMFDVLINLTPGVKWNMGNNWQAAGQVILPIYNTYGERYKNIRLNMAVVSKELKFGSNQFLKVSGGLFSKERYGLDVKWFYPVKDWFAFEAQVGLTGFLSMAAGWEASTMERITGLLGARFYINKANTEFRISAGRYIYKDYAVVGEVMRHFKHVTVGLYAQYNNIWKYNGGFKVIVMLPPYNRRNRKVSIRPASNFRLTYNINADPYGAQMYNTDPEENEREGDFNRTNLLWGSNRMASDFDMKGGVR